MEKRANIEFLIDKPVTWLSEAKEALDVALSSRIRLARNIAGIRFPMRATEADKNQVIESVTMAADKSNFFKNCSIINMKDTSEIDRLFMLERHLISKEFAKGNAGSSLILDEDGLFSLMLNEEDHLRMQVIKAGMNLEQLWAVINEVDDLIGSQIAYAFNPSIGYLTSCATNVGTGLRASVMLNLTGLTLLGHISGVINGVTKLGLAVRGLYGEGSEAFGNLYQISNQSTLGESEEDIIHWLNNIILQIITHEENAREILLQTKKNYLFDAVGRAYGILSYSYILPLREALNSLSLLRVGIDLGMFSALTIDKLNELFIIVQNAHLQKFANKSLSQAERDVYRADLVKSRIRNKLDKERK